MKLIELKCHNCGAKLKVKEESKIILCQFCGNEFTIEEEKNIEIKDLEKKNMSSRKSKLLQKKETIKTSNQEKVSIAIAISVVLLLCLVQAIFIYYQRNHLTKEKLINSVYSYNSGEVPYFGEYYYVYYFEDNHNIQMEITSNNMEYDVEAYGTGLKIMKNTTGFCKESKFVWTLKNNQVIIIDSDCVGKNCHETLNYKNSKLGIYEKENISKELIHC